jgi:hypothetical protein
MIISRPNVSAFAGLPPSQPVTKAGRRIAGGPLYALEEVLALVAAAKILLTRKTHERFRNGVE